MASPFIAEISMFAGNFAPRHWAFCNGQLLSISQNTALFSLLGTTYGGNGTTNFALPDLQGRLPVHEGQGPGLSQQNLGQKTGSETITLAPNQLPAHTHAVTAGTGGSPDSANPVGRYPADSAAKTPYSSVTGAKMASDSGTTLLASSGGSQPHNNLMPSLCINFIIATQGVFPSRN